MAYSLFFVLNLLLGCSLAFMDPCTFYPKWFNRENATDEFIPTPSCQKGIIHWNYPEGYLHIKFNQQHPFRLCLKNWIGGDALTLFDNSFGKKTPMKALSTEQQCIRSKGHRAVLDVQAPSELRYMAGFSFKINKQ